MSALFNTVSSSRFMIEGNSVQRIRPRETVCNWWTDIFFKNPQD